VASPSVAQARNYTIRPLGQWDRHPQYVHARSFATATLLPNKQVLVVGGFTDVNLASAELYDPGTGVWTQTGSMAYVRFEPHGDIAAKWAGVWWRAVGLLPKD